jgi:hypothetical protein
MKKLLILISFIFSFLLVQSQQVKFVSVNGAVDSLQHQITVKNLYKNFSPDSLPSDTLDNFYRWMRKSIRKLDRHQRKDSNIYIFFCPSSKDSVRGYFPISGKYGFIYVDS